MAVIGVETRTVEVTLPADPANPDSESKLISEVCTGTPSPILFGTPYFWLETMIIIKIESHPCYPNNLCLISMGMKQKN